MKEFKDLGLSEDTVQSVIKKGFKNPTPVQEKVIPLLLDGSTNIIAQAQTGSGKTAAFGLPLIDRLESKGHIQALVLTPTRELAVQVCKEIESLKGNKYLSMLPVYGGQNITIQIKPLRKGVDIVVGTPGRILDLIDRRIMDLSQLSHFILDEADEMLNMGFINDIQKIFKTIKSEKRVLLFSATIVYVSFTKSICSHFKSLTSPALLP